MCRHGTGCGLLQQEAHPSRENYCVTRKELLAVVKSLDFFHAYLYGATFTIRTDHAALRWLKSLKNPEGQLARWIGKLEQHYYTIVHRSGLTHGNADSLSRRPCLPECQHCLQRESVQNMCRRTTVEQTAEVPWEDLRKLQQEDRDLRPIMEWLSQSSTRPGWEVISRESPTTKNYWTQWDTLRMDNGVLQRRWVSHDGLDHYWSTMLPMKSREGVLKEMHDSIASGHLGVKKTLSRLRQRFYWVGMRKDVEEWCHACEVCCAKKGPKKRHRAPLHLYQVGAPMERVAVDIAGPLPLTTNGNRYICVTMDYFTKWPEAYAIPDQEATTIAKVLVVEFCRFGVPNELHSDQGRNFESTVLAECCKLLGIKKTRTTPLHPQSDGMVERFNWTLGQELAKQCNNDQSSWDQKLPALLMAYRSAAHETTGYSPAKLMFGRELRLPVDLLTGRPPGESLPRDASSFARQL
ncbi:protein NYNRIN-like isoform X1 [Eriocheir sinensis]|uniref:protein NYNRIN-like isoform X1 n=1 Tax=Eriocheir sinensis TaxID=95602 RepID=UPI0021C5ACC7|nr:protein NYNRIN-like isoform X1 [Eriocheir sinensis]